MQKEERKFGAIDRTVAGNACGACGSCKYQLVLSMKAPEVGKLLARCTHCHRLREIDDELGPILLM
jgi:cytochrome c2